jgi:hypothetical protein
MQPQTRWNIGCWILAFLLLLLLLHDWWQAAQQVEPVPYSEFEKALAEGRVAEVVVADRTLTGKLTRPDAQGKTVLAATRVEPDLAARLSQYGVPYTRVIESTFLRDLLSWVVPAVVFFGLWFFVVRRFAEKQGLGGFMNIYRPRPDRGADHRFFRRRSGQSGQRSCAQRHEPRGHRGGPGGFHPGGGAHHCRPGEEEPCAQSEGARGGRLPRDGPRADRAGTAGNRPSAPGIDHPARHWRAALAMPVHWYYDVAALQRDFGTLRDYQAPKDFHPNSIISPASISRGRRGSQVQGTPIGE